MDRRDAAVVDAGEGMGGGGGADRVDRDLDVAVGAVLEPDRHREAGAELAVDLALGGAGADRAPGDRVGDVLRGDRVEELAADRQPGVEDLEQELRRDPQAGVDVAGAVEVRVVDQPLPADRSPRLLEVDPHHDEEVLAALLGEGRQAPRVLERGLDVVDAAGPDDDHQPVVLTVEHRRDFPAPPHHRLLALVTQRQLAEQRRRGHQLDDPIDPLVANPVSSPLFGPDHHLSVTFLQSQKILNTRTRHGGRPEQKRRVGGPRCGARQAGRLAKSPVIGEAGRVERGAGGAGAARDVAVCFTSEL